MKLPPFLSHPSLKHLRAYALAHKAISGIVLVVVLGGGWFAYGAVTARPAATRYVLGTVASSTIVATVSESGQVSTTNSIDLKPQVSGQRITWIGVKPGDHMHAGQAIATIDSTIAQQSLADAKRALASDELTFEQSQAQAPISYQNDQTALVNAQESLADDYNSVYNDIVSSYLNLPDVMTGAEDAIYGYDFDTKKTQWNADVLLNLFNTNTEDISSVQAFKTTATGDYTAANAAYDGAVAAYQATPRSAATSTIDALLSQTITMETSVTDTLQNELNFYGAVSDLATTYTIALPSKFSTVQSATQANLATANQDLQTLLADKKTLDTAKQAITNDENTLKLDQVGNPTGATPISLQVSANNLEKEKEDVANQEANLGEYTVVSPFAGTVSSVAAHVGDTAGASAIATVITDTQIADISVNEVDAAKLKLGDKATLTFDAIDGLTLTGTVSEIDTVGTVSQGVVSYDVKIAFDTQDPRVKPGMTVNADIETGVAADALVVPQSAVKTVDGMSVVQVFQPPLPQAAIDAAGSAGVLPPSAPFSVPVVTGLSDTTNIQILSGLSAGEQVVVSTRSGSVSTASAAATSRLGGAGGATRIGGGGNAVFIPRGG